MILTTKGRFAVVAIVDIALNCSKNPVSLTEVAKRQDINVGYLEQIFLKLKKSGIVKSFRGSSGGYKLAKNSSDLTIYNIMLAVGENIKMTRCNLKGNGPCIKDKAICDTHNLWSTLENKISSYLNNVTIEDICFKKIDKQDFGIPL